MTKTVVFVSAKRQEYFFSSDKEQLKKSSVHLGDDWHPTVINNRMDVAAPVQEAMSATESRLFKRSIRIDNPDAAFAIVI